MSGKYFAFLFKGIFRGIEFQVNHFWWEVSCHSYLWSSVCNGSFFLMLLIRFSCLSLVFRNLTVMYLSVGFHLFVLFFSVSYDWVCWASWICGFVVFNKFFFFKSGHYIFKYFFCPCLHELVTCILACCWWWFHSCLCSVRFFALFFFCFILKNLCAVSSSSLIFSSVLSNLLKLSSVFFILDIVIFI